MVVMGKTGKKVEAAEAAAQKKESAPPKKESTNGAAEVSKAKLKGKAAKKGLVEEPSEKAFLSGVRPTPRPIFFFLFALVNLCVITLYTPCDVKGKKRDCGYPGITHGSCLTGACFLKGGGGPKKKSVRVTREEGATLGLELVEETGGGLRVTAVSSEGAAAEQAAASSDPEDVVAVGDVVLKVDGSTSQKSMSKSLGDVSAKTLQIEVRRSRLPSFLQWVQNKEGKPNLVEKVLTSSGSAHFAQTASHLMAVACPLWFLSGYPLASLPMYMAISAGTSLQLARCCYDEDVGSNVPHCYIGKRERLKEVVKKVAGRIQDVALKVTGSPKAYFDWLFVPVLASKASD